MCVISLVISLIILSITLSSEKYKSYTFDRRFNEEQECLDRFLKEVTDYKMYNQLLFDMKNGRRSEIIKEAQDILQSLPFMKGIKLQSNCDQDCSLAKIAYMINRGKVPYFMCGNLEFGIHFLNNQPNTYKLSDKDLMDLGRWIQNRLREKGVISAQVVFQTDGEKYSVSGLYWEHAHRSKYSIRL